MQKEFKIELKNVKFLESFSQETFCFQCDVWVNGVKSFYAENDGHGGSTNIVKHGKGQFLYSEIDDYFKSLPKIKSDDFEYNQTFESKVDDLFSEWLKEKDKKKLEKRIENLSKNNIVFQTLGTNDLRCVFWKDANKKNVPIQKLLSIEKFKNMVYEKINELKNQGFKILNTNIPNI
jgi:hypothetical protein